MVAKNTFGVMFFIRKNRGRNGRASIYARITVDGSRTELSLKMDVGINDWSKSKGLAKEKCDELKGINTILEQIRGRIVGCYQELKIRKTLITSEAIKNEYLGVQEEEYTLMKLFDYHNEAMQSILEWGTLKNYYTTKTYFQLFLKEVLHRSDIPLSELSYKFLIGYQKFMIERRPLQPKKPCRQNTIMKHIERLRKVVNLAIKNEWLDKEPFMKFKPSFIPHNREFLTEEELNTIEAKNFSIPRLQLVKDLFVFSCYTGLAYIDAYNLTPHNINVGIDGGYWLTFSRKKTDRPVRVPLLPKALEIIEKYKTHPLSIVNGKLLPVYSNQKLNGYLKEIADLCSIQKPLTFHIARHTFATTVTLTNGVPIESVSSMLGHTSIKTTQIYAKVIQKKVSEDMRALRDKLEHRSKPELSLKILVNSTK